MKIIVSIAFIALIYALANFFAYCLVTMHQDKENALDEKNEENNNESK